MKSNEELKTQFESYLDNNKIIVDNKEYKVERYEYIPIVNERNDLDRCGGINYSIEENTRLDAVLIPINGGKSIQRPVRELIVPFQKKLLGI